MPSALPQQAYLLLLGLCRRLCNLGLGRGLGWCREHPQSVNYSRNHRMPRGTYFCAENGKGPHLRQETHGCDTRRQGEVGGLCRQRNRPPCSWRATSTELLTAACHHAVRGYVYQQPKSMELSAVNARAQRTHRLFQLLAKLERALHLDQLPLRRVRLQVVANLALVAWVVDICRGYQPQTPAVRCLVTCLRAMHPHRKQQGKGR